MSLASALLDILGPVHFEPIDKSNPSGPCPPRDKAGDAFVMAVIQSGAVSCAYEDKVSCVYLPDGDLDAQRSDTSRCFETIPRQSSLPTHLAATSVLNTPSASQFRSATSTTLPALEFTVLPESVYLAAGQTEDALAQTMRSGVDDTGISIWLGSVLLLPILLFLFVRLWRFYRRLR
ncbi:hypothetical protein C8R46DRAFT_1135407 [Mycena filopes]|nr:hypothetical protein C8R46DRAFT_1135407 [Mycena filopes]